MYSGFLAYQSLTAALISSTGRHTSLRPRLRVDAVRGYDFVFGNRFHGNMVALQHGVPACVVCHDSRTEEMCQFLALPFVNIVDLASIQVQALYDIVDTAAWNQRYKTLYPQYLEFLRANNLSVKLRRAA